MLDIATDSTIRCQVCGRDNVLIMEYCFNEEPRAIDHTTLRMIDNPRYIVVNICKADYNMMLRLTRKASAAGIELAPVEQLVLVKNYRKENPVKER